MQIFKNSVEYCNKIEKVKDFKIGTQTKIVQNKILYCDDRLKSKINKTH